MTDIYVDDGTFRFVGVAMRKGLVGLWKKHHVVPIEALTEADPDSVTLKSDRQAVESAPTLDDPHAGPDEELQRAAREHHGLGAVL